MFMVVVLGLGAWPPGVFAQTTNQRNTVNINERGVVRLQAVIVQIGAQSLSVRSWLGEWVIHLSSQTRLVAGGNRVPLSLWKVGDRVVVDGNLRQSGMTLDATKVNNKSLSLVTLHGRVLSITGNTLTVSRDGGTTVGVVVDPSARIQLDGRVVSLSEIRSGMRIRAKGVFTTAATLSAVRVDLGEFQRGVIRGSISNLSSMTFTLRGQQLRTRVEMMPDTVFQVRGKKYALADVSLQNGLYVVVTGYLSGDRAYLAADTISSSSIRLK